MILGLSHIGFSCSDIEAATARLEEFGYKQRFDAPSLENHRAKTSFLSRHQPQHHIRALVAERAMAIELMDHGGLAGQQASTLVPVFRSDGPCTDWQPQKLESLPISTSGLAKLRDALGHDPLAFLDPVLSMTLLWAPANGQAPGLYACAAPTDRPDALATLLGQLRFRPNAVGLWSLLTPLPALQAHLIPVCAKPAEGWTTEPLLDAPGSCCIALMARGTDPASLPAAFRGKSLSFNLIVNGKRSHIVIARPDHGLIIELVEQWNSPDDNRPHHDPARRNNDVPSPLASGGRDHPTGSIPRRRSGIA